MPTYRLLVEYDGSRLAGWQIQPRGRTVQGLLLEALQEVLGERDLDLQGSGRTDAGVHALGQAASLRCRRRLDPQRTLKALDRLLPADIAVRDLRPAAPGFHARHDAVARAYRYQVARRRSAFGKRVTWWVPEPLDTAAMRTAAAGFVGRHDFRAFVRRANEAGSTVVVCEECELLEADDIILVRIVASHFLWNQVRRMVGALVEVGRGRARAEDVERWLAGEEPPRLAAPAAGLFLEAVRYPGEELRLLPPLPVGIPVRDARREW